MELSMRLAALQLHQLHSDPIFVRENLRKAGKTCGKPGGKSVAGWGNMQAKQFAFAHRKR